MQHQDEEREVRAARNQSLFRSVNEKSSERNHAFAAVTEGTYSISCECADAHCLERVTIAEQEYAQVRRYPRRFAVLPGHVYPEVEKVVDEFSAYVVVEKLGVAGEVAERRS
jgi:hypothetical protein